MMNNEFRAKQEELLERHERWVEEQGGLELPVNLDTYTRGDQRARVQWLSYVCFGNVLEVGCSWGYVAAQVGATVAVDVNPHLVNLARLLAPNRRFEVADARSLPFENASFNAVVLSELLEHLPWEGGVALALAEAVRVVNWEGPAARVIVTVPKADSQDAESFKHMWLNDSEHDAALRRMLGPRVAQDHIAGFDTYVKLPEKP